MTEINSKLRAYIEELDQKNVYLREMDDDKEGTIDLNDKIFEKLLSFGVVIPYADAVSYNRSGILIVGESGIGKSPLVRKMRRLFSEHSKELAFDSPTLYRSASSTKTIVYLDDIDSADHPFFVPFLFPESTEEFPITHIIHLKKNNELILRPGEIQGAINYMIFEGCGYPRTPETERKINTMMMGVHCYELLKPRGYSSDSNLRTIALQVKEAIETNNI